MQTNPHSKESLHARVENDFRNHPPSTPAVARTMDESTERFVDLAHWIVDNVPAGREQSSALTKLEECSMHSKAGIARNQHGRTQEPTSNLGVPGLPKN